MLDLGFEHAICYSGYRTGQSPGAGIFPTYKQIREDLLILRDRWKLIRLYDCRQHAETVLEVIKQEELDLQVLLGAHIGAEANNPSCPWGGVYPEDELKRMRVQNEAEIERLIALAARYPDSICALSVGNEATVEWTDHLVPVSRVIKFVRRAKEATGLPVTFCENYVPWHEKLAGLAEEVDFISIHTYPVWEFQRVGSSLAYTQKNYRSVAERYPEKRVVITEAGWTTKSNGRGIPPGHVNEEAQDLYHQQLMEWCQEEGIITFLFEAFDEDWKGSDHPNEPEKHWGLFTMDRRPKQAMHRFFPHLG
ncbi:MAG: glycosyl hydrolase [Rhodothermales bacterium]|nr:glycosyl hydrolase [Rhodothermales bacterium]